MNRATISRVGGRVAAIGAVLISVNTLLFPQYDGKRRRGLWLEERRSPQQKQHRLPVAWIWGSNQFGVVQPLNPPSSLSDSLIKEPVALELGNTDDTAPTTTLCSVSLGRYQGAAIDQQGRLYRWGASAVLDFQQIDTSPSGLVSPATLVAWPAHSPQCVICDPLLRKVQVGAANVYALRSTGEVLMISGPMTGESLQSSSATQQHLLPLPAGLQKGERLIDISSGSTLLVALSNQGRVFNWQASSQSWESIPIPADNCIKEIACGEAHCLARTKDGRVFGWGSNRFGQLGINSAEQTSVDSPVEIRSIWSLPNSSFAPAVASRSESKITHIAAGYQCSYAVQSSSDAVSLISFGNGQHGQLGNGTNAQSTYQPVRIKALSYLYQFDDQLNDMVPIPVERIYAGAKHALAVLGTGDGLVFGKDLMAWGSNLAGECGAGVKGGSIATPTSVQVSAHTTPITATTFTDHRRQLFHPSPLNNNNQSNNGWWRWLSSPKSEISNNQSSDYAEVIACGDQTTCIYAYAR